MITTNSDAKAPEFDQDGHRVRFEWGPNGLRRLAPGSDVVVIVDVLSFTTAVDIAVGRGATVLPYRWHDGGELHGCGSGIEKAMKGQSADVDLAAAHDASAVVPRLDGVAFVDAAYRPNPTQ